MISRRPTPAALSAECDSCGELHAQLPPMCSCGCKTFTVIPRLSEVDLEAAEDPDRRPYIWEQ